MNQRRLGLSDNQFKSFSMNGDDLYLGVILENFSDFAEVNVHGTCIEIAIVTPDLLECMASVDQLIYF
jgi:hypothetical protein